MRNTTRATAVVGAVLVTLGAGAGLAFAGDKGKGHAKGHTHACVVGPEQALINAPTLNCADVDVSDVTDTTTTTTTTITDSFNEVIGDTLNDVVDNLDLLGAED